MKHLVLALLLSFVNSISAQTSVFKANQEVSYFDGKEWIDSKVLEVGPNNTYKVWIDKKQTKSNWVKADDLESYEKDFSNDVVLIRTKISSTKTVPVLQVGDQVRFRMKDSLITTSVIEVRNDSQPQWYKLRDRLDCSWVNIDAIQYISSDRELEYLTISEEKLLEFVLNEEVEYEVEGLWKRGVITLMNDLDQSFIDGQWFGLDKIRKIKP